MGKSNKYQASNISSVANPASSSTISLANRSSILKSSFSPPQFQTSLFASVIYGIDSQHLRIHETSNGRLLSDLVIGPRASVSCLTWGEYATGHANRQEANRKRKRATPINGDSVDRATGDLTLAFGTSDSDIQFYSPAATKIVGTLSSGHTQGIRDFKFAPHRAGGEGWSIGGDAQAVLWDLKTSRPLRTIPLPYGPASAICPIGSSLICASHLAYILNPDSKSLPYKYNVATHSVHSIFTRFPSSHSQRSFLVAAENEHSMSVFQEGSATLIGSLRCGNEILHMDYQQLRKLVNDPMKTRPLPERLLRPEEVLAIVNKDGMLELFPEPFDFSGNGLPQDSGSTKARMQRRSRKSAAQVRITRQDGSKSTIPLIDVCLRGNQLILAWAEGGVDVVFDMIPWRDANTGNLLMNGNVDIPKGKGTTSVSAVVTNGVKDMVKAHVDESHSVVANGVGTDEMPVDDQHPEVIDISSGEEESEDSDAEDESGPQPSTVATTVPDENEMKQSMDVEMEDGRQYPQSSLRERELEQTEGPTFGDLIRATAPEAVDVQASFVGPNAQSLVPVTDNTSQQLPSGMSLGTVLTQSLRTNDKSLLELCFHVKELSTVRATIERLDSSFASTLLERLAERLHSRPGRAGSLMVWIQWTLICHGGYLAGRPDLMKKLASLHRVVKERANSLQSLLSLKGKLDMLEAQMNLRRNMQSRSRLNEEDDDEAIIYVEGQDDSDSGQDGEADEASPYTDDVDTAAPQAKARARTTHLPSLEDPMADGEDADSGEEMPLGDNDMVDSEDEASGSEENMFEDEASSTEESGDEVMSNETDHDDIDSDSSEEDTSPPPKRPAKIQGPNWKR